MKRFTNLIKYEGASEASYFLFEAPPGKALPPEGGIFVFRGEIESPHDNSGLSYVRLIAGHTAHLDQVWQLLPPSLVAAPWIHWQVAYLEIEEVETREAYAADLQAGFSLRNRAA